MLLVENLFPLPMDTCEALPEYEQAVTSYVDPGPHSGFIRMREEQALQSVIFQLQNTLILHEKCQNIYTQTTSKVG
jgi:hypothetical protein